MNEGAIEKFQLAVWAYYDAHGRHDLPWRQPEPDGRFDPYKIMVSEIMLQQTQVARVMPKYLQFTQQFPALSSLAQAELGDVLRAWQGLGYNRRAKYLWQAARQIIAEHAGVFPKDEVQLVRLPGIGKNTAGAIMAYAFNKPAVFLETNIRTAVIHHFFSGQGGVSDKDIYVVVEKALPGDPSLTRAWYWALMDYGAHLKQTIGNLNKSSSSYIRQSTFHGSKRKLRGVVIRLLAHKPYSAAALHEQIDDGRLEEVLEDLVQEGMVRKDKDMYTL